MATGWITVLRLVPWGEVIRNAPKVAEGAKRLWDKVSGRPAPPPASTGKDPVSELQAQMLAATELIHELARQNAQLVQEVEVLRRRLVWLAGAGLLIGGAVVVLLLRG